MRGEIDVVRLCSHFSAEEGRRGLTLAMTAISSDHPEGSPTGAWCRAVLTSSSTRAASLMTLLAAS